MKKNEDLAVLGLARRAGKLVVGAEECRRAIRRGVARVVVLAEDAAQGQRAKVAGTSRGAGVPVFTVPSRAALGSAVGKGPLTAVVVTDAGFANKLQQIMSRRAQRSRASCG